MMVVEVLKCAEIFRRQFKLQAQVIRRGGLLLQLSRNQTGIPELPHLMATNE
jgi:hypothetical protein